ncbi:secreted protein [Streptantibioticus cattleyicolor NRRL 8057 = DSM 46488]|uniref:Secreted protein n=2 Tax=Kitasatosporales TaxID=85011 RepID=F8JXU3_STREN|nr:secreted protein [Streptantibioticus cattleyicolor NRRL 8057 = DSM 46488]MYS58203.1 glycoside hydrolase family 92 protein [Streptomyces sp. SID5468]CCB73847.1 putative secreted protein [Streptantibioticus cattleyicolor NRRL 8057 = DSM 46488]
MVAAFAAAFFMAGPLPVAHAAAPASHGRLTDLVNPFIGTKDEGNTYPGAALPFGMVQLSPDTGHDTGYDYDQSSIRGFSAVHLSGVGCGLGGDLPVLPTTGEVTATDDAAYAASYTHADEQASPGYYRVGLTSYGGITAELTATTRTGWQRYTFPATDKANVLINTGQALHKVVNSSVTVVDDHTVAATITGRGFCQDTQPYTVYTVTRFNRPFTAHGTWSGASVTAGSDTSDGAGLRGAYVRFDTRDGDRSVVATTAISYVDAAGAVRNLDQEGRGTFDDTAARAGRTWEGWLAEARISGGTTDRQRVFYSSLYRALLSPNTGSDTDGRYTGWDGKVHRAKGFTYYQNWSLWDTYRTQAQLLSLLAPAQERDMALSLLRVDQEGGWLPKWGYATVETNIMTGDPVTPFLVNAYQQGLLAGHEEEAYRALRENADSVPSADSPYEGRGGNPRYLADGFVPLDPSAPHKPGDYDYDHGPSATLEYALADAALGTMARGLGHGADARRYAARGQNYRNVFDPRTGFFRARDADGVFTGPADPKDSVGFHEGTAWQYMWLVPQDLPGLVSLIGGEGAANQRLDSFFAYDKLVKDPAGTARNVWVNGPYSYYNQDKYNPQNEPDLIAPYTYLSTGQPWKTTDVVHAALTLFTDQPDGITGNDDLGTMSSWQVLSSVGLFPVSPGSAVWGLTTPAFDRVELTLDRRYYPAGKLVISAPGTSDSARYVQSVRVGGKRHPSTYVTTADIRAGRRIAYAVGTAPSAWGTRPGDAPPATDHVTAVGHHVALGVAPATVTVPADGTATLTASAVLTGPGTDRAVLTASAAAPLTADPARRRLSARSDGLPATVEVPLTVTVPAGTAPGPYQLGVELRDARGTTVSRTVTVTVTG